MRVSLLVLFAAASSILSAEPMDSPAAGCPACPRISFGPGGQAVSTRYVGLDPSYTASADVAAVGDLNNDGIPDLVAGGGNLLVFLGTGGGALAPPVVWPASSGHRWIQLADVDGDGNLDIAVSASGLIVILFGDGNGAFPRSEFGPGAAERFAIGDFDGDGVPDFATANYYSNTLKVYRRASNGAYSVMATLTVGTGNGSFSYLLPRAGDLNGDGIDDLAVASTGDGDVAIVLGRPDGALTAAPLPAFAGYGGDLRIADFDRDGVLDLAVQNSPGFGTAQSMAIFKGRGDGTFQMANLFEVGYSYLLTVADFDGDGSPDLGIYKLYDYFHPDNGLLVYPGLGNGFFDTPILTLTTGFAPRELVSADLNGDGAADVVLPNQTDEVVTILFGQGDGRFEESPRFTAPAGPAIVAADFNGDGIPDVATGTVSILLGDGQGGFQPAKTTPIAAATGIVVGDFNGDGKLDVAGADFNWTIQVLLGKGDGTFQSPISTAKEISSARVAAGDFNGDGKLDLLLHWENGGQLVFYAGNGNGTFATPVPVTAIPAFALAVADVNGDGRPDVLLSVHTSTLGPALRVLLGNGDGTFQAPINSPFEDTGNAIGTADFDEDGKIDVAVSYPYLGAVGLLFGQGNGSFGSPAKFAAKKYTRSSVVGDFDGDGHADLVLSGQDNNVTLLAGTGAGALEAPQVFAVPGTALASVIGDFDKDGKPDIAVNTQGSVYVPNDDFVVLLRNTACEARRLALSANPSTCSPANAPFPVQPVVRVVDDGGNLIACDTGTVSTAIVPGTGTPGALLQGAASIPVSGGVAAFSDLSIDRSGVGYVLEFHHATAKRTRSRTVTAGSAPALSIAGPANACATAEYTATAGFDTYVWTLDGAFAGTRGSLTITRAGLGVGPHTIGIVATRDGCAASSSRSIQVAPAVTAVVNAPSAVCPYSDGSPASADDLGPGSSYQWSIVNGVITAGVGTRTITFKAGPSGVVTLTVQVTSAQGCSDTATKTVAIDPTLSCPPPVGFFTVTPCRVADTRGAPGPSGGPGLVANGVRTFPVAGLCGIPASARAVAANVAVVFPAKSGDLRLFPAGTTAPLASTINFRPGIVRANNAILPLGATGEISVQCDMASGATDFFLDVYGYFQ